MTRASRADHFVDTSHPGWPLGTPLWCICGAIWMGEGQHHEPGGCWCERDHPRRPQ